MKDLSQHFKKEIKMVAIEDFKTTIFFFRFFFCLLCVYRGIPFSAMLPSSLVCWKDLDQFLLRQSFVNHPTMTVKMWKFLF